MFSPEVPVVIDLKNTPCAPNDFFMLDCNKCYCNVERTGYICTENICPASTSSPEGVTIRRESSGQEEKPKNGLRKQEITKRGKHEEREEEEINPRNGKADNYRDERRNRRNKRSTRILNLSSLNVKSLSSRRMTRSLRIPEVS